MPVTTLWTSRVIAAWEGDPGSVVATTTDWSSAVRSVCWVTWRVPTRVAHLVHGVTGGFDAVAGPHRGEFGALDGQFPDQGGELRVVRMAAGGHAQGRDHAPGLGGPVGVEVAGVGVEERPGGPCWGAGTDGRAYRARPRGFQASTSLRRPSTTTGTSPSTATSCRVAALTFSGRAYGWAALRRVASSWRWRRSAASSRSAWARASRTSGEALAAWPCSSRE